AQLLGTLCHEYQVRAIGLEPQLWQRTPNFHNRSSISGPWSSSEQASNSSALDASRFGCATSTDFMCAVTQPVAVGVPSAVLGYQISKYRLSIAKSIDATRPQPESQSARGAAFLIQISHLLSAYTI